MTYVVPSSLARVVGGATLNHIGTVVLYHMLSRTSFLLLQVLLLHNLYRSGTTFGIHIGMTTLLHLSGGGGDR